ncbi:ankyrin repeat domain-containing protein 7-like isoform X1 [Microplitis mediator]|uniref:ankyrin repeat domain-containing protein 7-like isoform X1 n=1 Tax=Microplitis mediator TaxID=375433 RepID=UPI00255612E6|nr:ankyrin repeat domain-containing protein 7-like isoform X1 [Microplitis mediator]
MSTAQLSDQLTSHLSEQVIEFHSAVENSDYDKIKVILKLNTVDVNATSNLHGHTLGFTALHLASISSNPTAELIVDLLLNYGANINSRCLKGKSALMYAVECQNGGVVKKLLDNRVDANLQDSKGLTALHYAMQQGIPDLVNLLLKYHTDINIVDNNDKTAFEYCYDNIVFYYTRENFKELQNDKYILYRNIYGTKYLAAANFFIGHFIKVADDMKNYKIFMLIENNPVTYYIYNEFEEQIIKMKKEKINNTNVSYYDFMTGDINQLNNYVNNPDIAVDLSLCKGDYVKKFPLFAQDISDCFNRAMERKKLIDESTEILNYVTDSSTLLENDRMQMIFELLDKADLNEFVNIFI